MAIPIAIYGGAVGSYGRVEAKGGTSLLIDMMLNGGTVVIIRQDKPVAELRVHAKAPVPVAEQGYRWLKERRSARRSLGPSSLELLERLCEER